MPVTRVLIADDHAVVRTGLRYLIEHEPGLELVGEAPDGTEAVRLALDLRPDVLVMDIGMPGLNGLEVARILRREAPGIHIVVLTVHDDQEYFRQLVEIGVAGYILKSSADSTLVDSIRAAQRGEALIDPSLMGSLIGMWMEKSAPPPAPGATVGEATPALTTREVEVLRLTARGYTGRQIAEQLSLSISTVETHRTHLMRKLQLEGRADLVQYAIRHGFLGAGDE